MPDALDRLTPGGLDDALAALGRAIAYPTASPDFASRVGARLELPGPAPRPWWSRRPQGWPILLPAGRTLRSVLVAVVLLLVLAAVAGALGLGLPGIRLTLGPAPTEHPGPSGAASGSPQASGAPGAFLGLGLQVPLTAAGTVTGFQPRLPFDPAVGTPDAAFVLAGRLSLTWAPRPGLPATSAPDVGLLLTEFEGTVDPAYYDKVIHEGVRVEPVSVGGRDGFWISGETHFFFYVDPHGQQRDETRRKVGDVLIWSDGSLTLRLETSLGRDEAIRIASTID